jgi:hypothetical protein
VPGIGTVDLRPALAALVQPAGPLLLLAAVKADATARCSSGNPALDGSSSLASLSVLGSKLATTEPTERAINAIDSQSIDPSNLDISKVLAPTAEESALQPALQPVLDQLPTISVPAVAAQVKVTPGEELRSGDKLTRRALHVQISLGGQSVLDPVVGEATVDATGVSCGSLAAAALGLGRDNSCTKRRITLIDVLQRGNRVKLQGAADPRRFAGRRVSIIARWDRKVVARLRHPPDLVRQRARRGALQARRARALQGHAEGPADRPRVRLQIPDQGALQAGDPALDEDVHAAAIRTGNVAVYRAA